MESLLVSACLLGFDCKYSGGNNALPPETLLDLLRKGGCRALTSYGMSS